MTSGETVRLDGSEVLGFILDIPEHSGTVPSVPESIRESRIIPHIDFTAADRLVELREKQGLSQEGLAGAISRHAQAQGWLKPDGPGKVSPDVIRWIEDYGHVPSVRVRLVISLFFGLEYRDIWEPQNRRVAPAGPRPWQIRKRARAAA